MKKILLIIAGVVAIVVVIGAVLLYANRDKITNFATDRTLNFVEAQLMEHIPDPATEVKVKVDFRTLHERLQAGKVKSSDVKDLAALFYTSYRDEKLDSTEVRKIIDQVHKLVSEQ